MDPFNRIPPEVREMILVSLGTLEDVRYICYASPIMLQQFAVSKTVVIKRVFPREVSSRILQDLIAVATFPEQAGNTNEINRHLEAWGRKQLPDPLTGYNSEAILTLSSVYQRICWYINDYLSRSTSHDLRLSYLRIPFWAHQSYWNGTLDKLLEEEEPSKGPISLSQVSPEERERLLRAFLHYELICKTCRPRPEYPIFGQDDLSDIELEGQAWPRWAQWSILGVWDWTTLAKFEEIGADNWVRNQPWERDMLHCVHSYVTSLYGAMFARASDPEHLEFRKPNRPDTLVFFPSTYDLDVGVYAEPYFLGLLASFGFDLVHAIITSPKSTIMPAMTKLDQELSFRAPEEQPGHVINPYRYSRQYIPQFREPGYSRNWRYLIGNICLYPDDDLWTLYRQRAFAFFYHDYYPPGCRFPVGERWQGWRLQEVPECELGSDYMKDALLRAFASLHDQDEDKIDVAENDSQRALRESFEQGEADCYPSIEAKLTPFWQ
ncbi:hypothetical protein FALBO_3917 [Fusarium albosuccineum]|uniref:Uncharacterized protein n=1 Tax=Fusarium albosuccineum TaxID=1237068 RepID=A0A8H4PFK0_9HYPO|nr:hypothetical protein FALBO_3917 [Fusarium albosuccineum]